MKNRVRIFTYILTLLAPVSLFAQGWEPVGNVNFRDAYNFGRGEVVLAASSGSLYWSLDNGVSFRTQPLDDSSGLNSVQFHDEIGIAASDSNRFFFSNDNGGTWTKHYLPSRYGINNLTFAGNDTIFACGNRSTILRSTNAGVSWAVQAAPGNCNLLHIKAVSSQELFITADSGYLFSTLDGGAHWARTHISFIKRGPTGSFDIAPNGEWLAAGDSTSFDTSTASCVGISKDGGITWDVHCIDTSIFAPIYARFLSNETIVVFQQGFFRYISTNDGNSWDSFDVRQNGNFPTNLVGYNGFWQTVAGSLIVFGDDGSLLDIPDPTKTGNVMHTYGFFSSGECFGSIGGKTNDLRGIGDDAFVSSSDGGASWVTSPDPNFGYASYIGLHFSDDTTGAALTLQSNAKINFSPFSTTNNGVTWQKILPAQMPHESWTFSTIGSNGDLFITSDTGIDYSTDNGLHWSRWGGYREPYDSNADVVAFGIYHAAFFGMDTAYLQVTTIGSWPGNVFLVTYDHGQTWKRSIIDASSTIFSMAFLNSKIGMFSLEGGNIYRTSDGGNSWTMIHVGPYSYRLWSVCFNHSGTVGVLCGDSGFVAYSLDSGKTWTPESVPMFGAKLHDNHGLSKVYALSDTTFLIQGSYSLYRKTFHLSGPPASINPALAQYVFLQTYPNPASGQTHFLISGLNHNPNAQLQVELYDIMGREVRDLSAVANLQRGGEVTEFYADFSSLSSGVYTVRYTLGSYSHGQPVIITH